MKKRMIVSMAAFGLVLLSSTLEVNAIQPKAYTLTSNLLTKYNVAGMSEESVGNKNVPFKSLANVSLVHKDSNTKEKIVTYKIKEGDTVENIAKAFDTSVEQMITLNDQLDEDTVLSVGDKIKVKTTKDPKSVKPVQLKWEDNTENSSTVSYSDMSHTPSGRQIQVVATGYSMAQPGMSNLTASGLDLNQNDRVIAVDPSYIPLGTRVYVPGYGEAIAADTGGAILGNRIDIHFPTVSECNTFGIRAMTITILD